MDGDHRIPDYVGLFVIRKTPLSSGQRSFFDEGRLHMETRVAIAAIVVENPNSIEQMNQILHEYRAYIIGRMGIPYPNRRISLISVAVDAPTNIISALSGKLGKLPGLSVKTVYSKLSNSTKEG